MPESPLPSTTPVVEQTEEEFQIELKKVGAFRKAGMMLKRYGAAAVGVYATLYAIPVGGTFLTAQAVSLPSPPEAHTAVSHHLFLHPHSSTILVLTL
jgi:hypothetical protein